METHRPERMGELQGTVTGNVMHFTWKEHKYNQVGPSSTSTGKGYFQYKMNSDKTAELDGQLRLERRRVRK